MASDDDEALNTIIIGIDFGTTYSGVAFTWSKKIERMEVITSWEYQLHSTSDEEKTPTALSYDSNGNATWGYNIPLEAERAQWFKLLLIDETDLPEDVRGSKKIQQARDYLKKHKKTPIAVIAEYLRLLWNHCNQRILDTVGRALVNYSRFHIVITVPAIWPQYARARMREAAKEAGMITKRVGGETQLDIISEPEAAALATMADMDDRCDVKVGDKFVVVDCGGGTVDIISYEVTSMSPMSVKECVKGQGALCGAVFVDEAFTQLLKNKFGKRVWKKMTTKSRVRLLHDEWEHGIKPMFDGTEQDHFPLPVPFECINFSSFRPGGPAPQILVTTAEVRMVFDPVVEKIGAMVAEQSVAIKSQGNKGPKYVMLVGGFGRCKYLLTSLKRFVDEDVDVLQSRGSAPWTAICRGAVIHASTMRSLGSFTVDVQSRVSRASYGVTKCSRWDSSKHIAKDKFWHDAHDAWYAYNQMAWTLKAGEEMVSNKPVRFSFNRYYPADGSLKKKVHETIYICTDPSPPSRKEPTVQKLCSVEWDAELDLSTLPTFTNQIGKVYYRLSYEIEMTCVGGSLDFAWYHNGKRQGSKNVIANYDIKE